VQAGIHRKTCGLSREKANRKWCDSQSLERPLAKKGSRPGFQHHLGARDCLGVQKKGRRDELGRRHSMGLSAWKAGKEGDLYPRGPQEELYQDAGQ